VGERTTSVMSHVARKRLRRAGLGALLVGFATVAAFVLFASPASAASATVAESPSPVAKGSALTATWSGIASPTSTDWVGLYPSSGTPNSGHIAYQFTNGASSGSLQITVPASAATGSTYELRLFAHNTFTLLATSAPFTVQTTTVAESPDPVIRGTQLSAAWAGIPSPTATDFVALYPSAATANSGYLTYAYTTGAASGSVPLTVPASATPGSTYELRLFSHGTFTRLDTSAPFSVIATTVSASPATVPRGSAVTATWAGIASPTGTDFVAVYPSSGSANSAYVAYAYTTGTQSGSVPITIPASATPGSTYELRLFSHGTFTRLATSGTFSVS